MGVQEFGERQDGKGGISDQEDYEKQSRQKIDMLNGSWGCFTQHCSHELCLVTLREILPCHGDCVRI